MLRLQCSPRVEWSPRYPRTSYFHHHHHHHHHHRFSCVIVIFFKNDGSNIIHPFIYNRVHALQYGPIDYDVCDGTNTHPLSALFILEESISLLPSIIIIIIIANILFVFLLIVNVYAIIIRFAVTVVRLRGESGEVDLRESARAIMDSEIHGVYLHRRVVSQLEIITSPRRESSIRSGGMLLTPKESHESAALSENGYVSPQST